jgi:hypothetical protein
MDTRAGLSDDEQAVERYRYLLRTAPPDAIEQAHTEAFTQLTPEQRRLVLEGLSADLPAHERSDRDDPRSLARMATRAEMRRPGTMERTFGGMNPAGGIGMGGLMAGSFLSTIAGVVIGTAVADAIFNDGGDGEGSSDGSEGESDQGDNADSGDSGDFSGGDDFGGGDFGGDFGGGDFGGGDFGGGEF